MSMFFKLKKRLASSLSEMKWGRGAMTKMIGADGQMMSNALKQAAKKKSGPEEAKKLKVHMVKLLSKVAVLFQNEVLTTEMIGEAKEACLLTFDYTLETLRVSKRKRARYIPELIRLLWKCHDMILPLLTPLMKENNWSRLTALFQYYASEDFLNNLLCSKDYTNERLMIKSAMEHMVSPFETEVANAKTFLVRRLTNAQKDLSACLNSTNISVILAEGQVAQKFQDYNVSKFGPASGHLVNFCIAVDSFRSISKRAMLTKRGKTLASKYLGNNSTHSLIPGFERGETRNEFRMLVEKTRNDIATASQLHKNDFNEVYDYVIECLGDIYRLGWKKSAQYLDLKDYLEEMHARLRVLSGEMIIDDDDDDGEDTEEEEEEEENQESFKNANRSNSSAGSGNSRSSIFTLGFKSPRHRSSTSISTSTTDSLGRGPDESQSSDIVSYSNPLEDTSKL